MSNPTKRVEKAEAEAAAWHVRLGERSVSTQTIEDFFAWRRDPKNAEAYGRVEAAWAGTRTLGRSSAVNQALDAALARKPARKTASAKSKAVSASIVCAVAVGAVGVFTWLQRPTEYATSVGEQRVVQLADGSRVHLDTASEIRVRFSGAGRIVTLDRGQAFFEVAPDASRPFTVEAGQASVTALGTSFDVRRSGGSTQVVLVTGRVEVKSVPGAPAKVMAPGQAAVLSGSAPVVSAADVERATSWKQGRLIFRDTPLPVAVAEINRYLDKGIVLDAPGLSQTTVNGVFETGDRDAFVSTAAEVFGLRAVPGPDGTVRLVVH